MTMWDTEIPNKQQCNIEAEWLNIPGNLTQKLRDTFGEIKLNLIYQGPNKTSSYNDCSYFQGSEYFIRRIYLEHNGMPLTCGICIFDQQGYQHYQEKIASLGTKAIGETLLYKDTKVTRSSFYYSMIEPTHFLHQQACQDIKIDINDCIWARSSIFSLAMGKMQLIELFLPTIKQRIIVNNDS